MNRSTRVCLGAALFVGAEEYAYRIGPAVAVAAMFVLAAASIAMIRMRWTGVRRAITHWLGIVLVAVLGGAYGVWYQWFCPSRPAVTPGVETTIVGQLQSVKHKASEEEYVVRVTRQESTRWRCAFYALVLARSSNASLLASGETVEASGIYIQSTETSTALDRLAPIWLFEGTVQAQNHQGMASKVDAVRQDMLRTVAPANEANVDLALSMVIGRSLGLPASIQQLFLEGGVTHLLVASGANVALVVRSASILLRPIRRISSPLAPWIDCAVLMSLLWGFVVLCGSTIPIVRAALFTSYLLVGRAVGRSVGGLVALTVSSFFFAVTRPIDLFEPSGLLSLIATFAVFEASSLSQGSDETWPRRRGAQQPTHRKRLRRVLTKGLGLAAIAARRTKELFLLSLIVDAYLLPITWWMFGQITPFGALSTAFMEPVVACLIPLTIAWGTAAWLAALLGNGLLLDLAKGFGEMTVRGLGWSTDGLSVIAASSDSLIALPNLPFSMAVGMFLAMAAWRRVRLPHHFPHVMRRERVKRETL